MPREWHDRGAIKAGEMNAHLVVTPGKHDIIKATVGLVDTVFC
jgi:hypothetical protein